MTPLPLPARLSPSKISTYQSCPRHFQYIAVDGLTEPGTVATERGSLVHAALERLFALPAEMRTREAAGDALVIEATLQADEEDFMALHLDEDEDYYADAERLLAAYFTLEDPRFVEPVGIELAMEMRVDGVPIKGIIDQLRIVDGEWIVVDWKTGAAPAERYTQKRLEGVGIYALFCEQMLGIRPAAVKLYYLGGEPTIITKRITSGSLNVTRAKIGGVWEAVKKACETDDFRPSPSALCDWCHFKPICPAHN